MLLEVSILTGIIAVCVAAMAYIDTKYEKKLMDAIEKEQCANEKTD